MKYLMKFEKLTNDLIYFVRNYNMEGVRRLVNVGVDLNEQDHDGNTPLTWAASNSYIQIIKLLVDAGADLNIRNNKGQTPLIIAAAYASIEAIVLLIDGGADWNIIDNDGKDFLDYFKGGNKTIVMNSYPDKYKEYLIKKDAGKYNL